MAEEEDPIDSLKREAFGDLAHQAEVRTTGSGISETTRLVLDLLADPGRLRSMPPPWIENRTMILTLFRKLYAKSLGCPGPEAPQCCQATTDMPCVPNWRPREDAEWYAQEINKYLSSVDGRLRDLARWSAQVAANEVSALRALVLTGGLIADEAFELGCLLTEAEKKFRWDRFAKQGQRSAEGARRGGLGRRGAKPNRQAGEQTVTAVDALLQRGMKPMAAYKRVAKEQNVTSQTIAKEYRRAKKQG